MKRIPSTGTRRSLAYARRTGCVLLATPILVWLLPWGLGLAAAGGAKENANKGPTVPRRIITIAPNSAEILCALGVSERIVGVSKFCVYPPELKSRPRVGGLFDPDLEMIAALRPDLVVLRGNNPEVERLCQSLSIRVYHDPTEKLDDVKRCIKALGDIVGQPAEADGLIQAFQGHLDAIRGRVRDRPRPRVLLVVSRNPEQIANVLTAGKSTFLDEMITIAGGENVFGHLEMPYPQVGAETILAQQPEAILELMPERSLTPAQRKELAGQWAAVGSMPAVKNDAIHFLTKEDAENALIPSPRYVEIIDRVSHLLHPEPTSER